MAKLRNYIGILLGAIITAVALNMFLIPHKIADGGVAGFATVLYYLFGTPVGLTMLAVNIPLLLISVKYLGRQFGLSTLFGATVLALAIDLTKPYIPVLTNDLLLNTLYGGVVEGIGMGLVFRFGGTTAGTDLAAAIINKFFGMSLGQALLAVDFFVIALAGISFHSAELSLYSLISLFVATQIVDLIQQGPSSAKAFFIMSNKSDQVAAAIIDQMSRGVTILDARGGYTGKEQTMLLCVVSTSEVSILKEVIHNIDDLAFVIVADVHEVLGEGFSRFH